LTDEDEEGVTAKAFAGKRFAVGVLVPMFW
jgi:hypothetical protein